LFNLIKLVMEKDKRKRATFSKKEEREVPNSGEKSPFSTFKSLKNMAKGRI